MEATTYKAALRELVNRQFLASVRYSEQQLRADRPRCHPELILWEKAFIKRLKAMGVPAFCHCAYRSDEAQQQMLDAGTSRAGPGQSPHNYGLAVDIIHGTLAWELRRKAWDIVGHVGKEVAHQRGLKLEWGGDWAFYDPAHWQMAGWKELKDPASWKRIAA